MVEFSAFFRRARDVWMAYRLMSIAPSSGAHAQTAAASEPAGSRRAAAVAMTAAACGPLAGRCHAPGLTELRPAVAADGPQRLFFIS